MLLDLFIGLYYRKESETNMQAQLWPNQDGRYYADFMFDDSPRGFEDRFQESLMVKRLIKGALFAELGEPDTSHLAGNPMAVVNRYAMIEDRNIAGHLTCESFMDNSGFRLWLQPCGPNKEVLLSGLTFNPRGYALRIRIVKGYLDDDEVFDDDEEVTLQTYTADVIKL